MLGFHRGIGGPPVAPDATTHRRMRAALLLLVVEPSAADVVLLLERLAPLAPDGVAAALPPWRDALAIARLLA